MKQTFLIIIIIAKSFYSLSQVSIADYKIIVDKEISKYFDSSILNMMRCQDVRYFDIYGTETWSPNFENVKFEKVKMKPLFFTYNFYSKTLNDTFAFGVSINKQKNKKIIISGLNSIPTCILTDRYCKFINRDSAIKIAIKDSILYPENLTSSFEKPYNKKSYYWVIKGTLPHASTEKRRTVAKVSSRSRKIIDATTGQLISWQDYHKPD